MKALLLRTNRSFQWKTLIADSERARKHNFVGSVNTKLSSVQWPDYTELGIEPEPPGLQYVDVIDLRFSLFSSRAEKQKLSEVSTLCVCVCVCVCLHSLYCLNQLIDFYEISYERLSLECHTFEFLTNINMTDIIGTYCKYLKWSIVT